MTEQKAILAAGCFWGVEELFRKLPGVLKTEVGYCGGKSAEDALYSKVKTGQTGHAESILIHFDRDIISFEKLLHAFFKLHDPTTPNQQGNDIGTQYRSAIFCTDSEQKVIAEKVKKEVDASGKWKRPVITQILDHAPFYNAEDYHQDYLQKNPNGYTCHYWRE